MPFARDFGEAGPTALLCRKDLQCRKPGLWAMQRRRPFLAKTPDLRHYIPAAPVQFAQDFGKAGPTAPFCRKDLQCSRPGLVCPDFWVVVVLRSPIHANEPSEYNGMLYRTSNRVLNNGIKVIILICMDGTSQYHHHRLLAMRRRRPFLAKNPDFRHYVPAVSPG